MVSDVFEIERWRGQLRRTIGAGPTDDPLRGGHAMPSHYDAHAGSGRDIFGAAESGRPTPHRAAGPSLRCDVPPSGRDLARQVGLATGPARPLPPLRRRRRDARGRPRPGAGPHEDADRGLPRGRPDPARRDRARLHDADVAGRRPGADRQGGPTRLPLPQRPGRGGRLGGRAGADGSGPAPPRRGPRRRDAPRAPRPPDPREPAVGPRHAAPAGRPAPDRRRRPGRRHVRVPRARIPAAAGDS